MLNFTNTYVLAHLCVEILVNNVVYVQTTTKELLQYIIMYKTISVVQKIYFVNNSILNQHTLQWGNTGRVLVHRQVLTPGAEPPSLLDT